MPSSDISVLYDYLLSLATHVQVLLSNSPFACLLTVLSCDLPIDPIQTVHIGFDLICYF